METWKYESIHVRVWKCESVRQPNLGGEKRTYCLIGGHVYIIPVRIAHSHYYDIIPIYSSSLHYSITSGDCDLFIGEDAPN